MRPAQDHRLAATIADGVTQLIGLLRKGEATTVVPSTAAHENYEERRIAAAKNTIFGSGCASWYLDATGVPSSWPWSYDAFAEAMAAPKMEDYVVQ